MSSNQSDNDAPPKQPKSEFSSDELTNWYVNHICVGMKPCIILCV